MTTQIHQIVVACRNASGEADVYVASVECDAEAHALGVHYAKAEAAAEEAGYEGPFVCYAAQEQGRLIRAVKELPGRPLRPYHLDFRLMRPDGEVQDLSSAHLAESHEHAVSKLLSLYRSSAARVIEVKVPANRRDDAPRAFIPIDDDGDLALSPAFSGIGTIEAGNLEIRIERSPEGMTLDVRPAGRDTAESLGTLSVLYAQAIQEKK